MATHDYVISNQSFPSTRTDLNNVLQAIVSNNSNATAPSTTYANMIWYDTANNKLYIRNEDNDAWIELFVLDQTGDHLEKIGNTITLSGTGSIGINAPADDVATIGAETTAYGSSLSNHTLGVRGGVLGGTAGNTTNVAYFGSESTTNNTFGLSLKSYRQSTGNDWTTTGFKFTFNVDSSDALRDNVLCLDNSGKVGIGTNSPQRTLDVTGTFAISNNTTSYWDFDRDDTDGRLKVSDTGTERSAIDSSGNLLVGKTAVNTNNVGVELYNSGIVTAVCSGRPIYANRKDSDGSIIEFAKDNTTVGSINSRAGLVLSVVLDPRASGAGLTGSTREIQPTDENGNSLDNAVDCGAPAVRFDDIRATNGTIQTSDQNEKQQIASLTDAEITAAKAISKLFKTFKWNDKVEAKGDNARTHAGVIAQDVSSAMTDAGLDATKYAFFCSDTWWETQTEVPAVEAVEAQDAVYETQTDEEGNETQVLVTEAVEAVEARDAYTRTDIYDTAEEAPESATERTRMGIRYPELLAFIGAATEQRLTSIEARLTALEG